MYDVSIGLKTNKGPKLDLIKPESIVKAKKKKIRLKLKSVKRDVSSAFILYILLFIVHCTV